MIINIKNIAIDESLFVRENSGKQEWVIGLIEDNQEKLD